MTLPPPRPTDDHDDPRFDRPPDLSQLPPEQWKEALRPLTFAQRQTAILRLGLERGGPAALAAAELELEERERRTFVPTPGPPRTVAPSPGDPARRVRQVNLKLQPREHADLLRAAEQLGLRPTVLARLLVARGVALALRS